MFRRIKQFFQAITANLDTTDHSFVNQYLNSAEQSLFYAMDLPTQRHCINVAQTSLRLLHSKADYQVKSSPLLIKSALLHDSGKPARAVTTTYRIITVVANALSPKIGQYIAKPGIPGFFGPLRYAFYIQREHPQLGANLAEQFQLDPFIVKLIAKHHQPAQLEDTVELQILRQADDLN